MSKKIIVVGGHMAPALGFIHALPKDMDVLYVGRKHPFEGDMGLSLEYKTIRGMNISFEELQTGRLQRKVTAQTIPSLMKTPKGFLEAFSLLKREKPDAVVAFGGYLSLPIGAVAALLRIPLILHESTFGAGLANKILAPFAKKICVSSDSSRAYFPARKTVVTGNPMLPFEKENITSYLPKSKEKLPLVVVVGGSAGSHAINSVIMQSLDELLSSYKIIHQTGDSQEYKDFEKIQSVIEKLDKKKQERYLAVKYIEPQKVNAVFNNADIVISRGGFNTITMLLLLKKKSVVIPLSFGQKNEQQENAKLLEQAGYGLVLNQETLTREKLIDALGKMLAQKMDKKPQFIVPIYPNGAENLVKEVLSCLKHRQDD